MTEPLQGKRVALLVVDGFEQIEPTEPKRELEQAGATAQICLAGRRPGKGLAAHRLG